MTKERAAFDPQPVRILIGHEEIEIRSLACAIGLIRSLRHDRLGTFAEKLLSRMESAELPAQQAEAWAAFRNWASACGLAGHGLREAA